MELESIVTNLDVRVLTMETKISLLGGEKRRFYGDVFNEKIQNVLETTLQGINLVKRENIFKKSSSPSVAVVSLFTESFAPLSVAGPLLPLGNADSLSLFCTDALNVLRRDP